VQSTDVFVTTSHRPGGGRSAPAQPTRRPPIVSHVTPRWGGTGRSRFSGETDQDAGSRWSTAPGPRSTLPVQPGERRGDDPRPRVVMARRSAPSTPLQPASSRRCDIAEGIRRFHIHHPACRGPGPERRQQSTRRDLLRPTPRISRSLRAGFNTLFGGLFGSCEYGATLADEAAAGDRRGTGLLDKTRRSRRPSGPSPPVLATRGPEPGAERPAGPRLRQLPGSAVSPAIRRGRHVNGYHLRRPELFDPLANRPAPHASLVSRGRRAPPAAAEYANILYQEIHKPPYS